MRGSFLALHYDNLLGVLKAKPHESTDGPLRLWWGAQDFVSLLLVHIQPLIPPDSHVAAFPAMSVV